MKKYFIAVMMIGFSATAVHAAIARPEIAARIPWMETAEAFVKSNINEDIRRPGALNENFEKIDSRNTTVPPSVREANDDALQYYESSIYKGHPVENRTIYLVKYGGMGDDGYKAMSVILFDDTGKLIASGLYSLRKKDEGFRWFIRPEEGLLE